MKKNNTHKDMLTFFAEIGQLKRVKRSGWWTAGINNGESVADHSFRCAVIGYCLAHLEGSDPYKVALMCLINDIHEARINDQHKIAARYYRLRNAEKKAFNGQMDLLPTNIKKQLTSLMNELWNDTSKESIIARDADLLECMVQGKEYYEQGYRHTKAFYKKAYPLLKTKHARTLARLLEKWNAYEWCERLVRMER